MRSKHYTKAVRERLRNDQIDRCRHPGLAHIIEKNIATIARAREHHEQSRSTQDRLADFITAFSGSMLFVYAHMVWFAVWVVLNLGLVGFQPFDPFPFGLLTLVVSLEAIFLSTFVLLSQNRQAAVTDQRADMDLQINLLAEYEVTRLLLLVDSIAKKLGVEACDDPELGELEQKVEPEELLKEMNQAQGKKSPRDKAT